MKKFSWKLNTVQIIVLLVVTGLIIWKVMDTPSRQDKADPYKDLPKHTEERH